MAAILSECPPQFVDSFEAGQAALAELDYDYVIIGSLFAESRMFEFAQHVRAVRPSARVVCIKAAGRPLDEAARAAVSTALSAIGCEGLLDLTAGEIPQRFHTLFNQIIADCRARPGAKARFSGGAGTGSQTTPSPSR